jgi:hypothetical protein
MFARRHGRHARPSHHGRRTRRAAGLLTLGATLFGLAAWSPGAAVPSPARHTAAASPSASR